MVIYCILQTPNKLKKLPLARGFMLAYRWLSEYTDTVTVTLVVID